MNKLIGKKFRMNKYGLSLWTDTIREVSITWELVNPVLTKRDGIVKYIQDVGHNKKLGMIAHIKINRIYDLDEIIIYP